MKVAVVGAGVMGQHHIRVYRELGVLAAVCDVDKSKQVGVPLYTDLTTMLLEIRPDAVSVAVPTPMHLQTARECLDAGCHLLVEKPLADNLSTAEDLVKLANESQKVLSVGYIERYNPAFRALESLVANGAFGEITSVNIKRVGGIPRSANNIILDLMTHDFNLLQNVFQRQPDSFHVHKRQGNILDSAQVLLSYGNASATCEANWISPIKIRQLHMTGTRGYAELDLIKQELMFIPGAKSDFKSVVSSRNIYSFQEEPLKAELQAFLSAIMTGDKSQIVTGEEGVATLKLTLQVGLNAN